jgi:hypothetical protein
MARCYDIACIGRRKTVRTQAPRICCIASGASDYFFSLRLPRILTLPTYRVYWTPQNRAHPSGEIDGVLLWRGRRAHRIDARQLYLDLDHLPRPAASSGACGTQAPLNLASAAINDCGRPVGAPRAEGDARIARQVARRTVSS